ncbi:hypothetical protein MMUR_00700 [Mycolicibacterium murale]|uniref:Uncharacterized protein n=1 Tax=Mycolicibacterium murale TaxID=182220 RepID=A0A7I9WE30_9MYCO|nr:hypothetical protein [Mycolicibacterium murale]GFG55934.1 hypothetical protein MMUR_00700 [Mycolicibacterium murale]
MPAAVAAVLARDATATAVCDLPRSISDPVATALDDADLVVVVTTCDVRAATVAMAPAISAVNPNVGLVVRGRRRAGCGPRRLPNSPDCRCWRICDRNR